MAVVQNGLCSPLSSSEESVPSAPHNPAALPVLSMDCSDSSFYLPADPRKHPSGK